ncbi:site-specific integrase [Enterococcus faecalis]|uniref:tyrosine-type recombinase/integrase n=1 Tax=Enterococcus TaxID=1350 RepID=UPI0008C52542|nr:MULTISPECIES: tyrosine-type recombinase/integrase [Enterococcus]MBC9721902.1 tyrosine-type recombinase/integrase [Lactobacillus sp.]EGO7946514.1 site-specific integrase [Enterococcus faecalis]EIY8109105.1 tyrosine-type recombinase/integrase [Enterococcus faecalis]PQD42485.1 site-specific integrase [Enterococcus faecalis]SET62071.1 Site-specific recombinase XerD [Enterococcus malodoratus]
MVKIKNIYQDKQTKKWYFRAYLGTDESCRKIQKTKRGFESQREAKRAYDKYLLTHGFNESLSNQISSANQMTFEEFYRVRFVNWYEKQVKPQTYENAQFIFEKKMRYFYHLKIKDIGSQDIEDWMYELSQTATRSSKKQEKITTLSKNYINRILGHLKIILARAVNEGLIERNPVDDVASLPKENTKVDFWEIDEFQKVMEVIPETSLENHHRKIVFEILFYTGLRIGELEALTWKHVDLKKNQITVEKTLIYKTKNDWYLSTPKTKTAYRTIGIGKKLSEKLNKWKELQGRIGNFEFVCQLDGTFTPPYCFSNWLKGYAEKAGVRKIKLHSLRHSHVAMLVEQNIQPLVIKERLGHSNIQITLGTYGHLYAKSDEQVVNVLDQLVS